MLSCEITAALSGSELVVPVGFTYGFTLEDGAEPMFFVDGVAIGVGSSAVSIPAGGDDLVIGNQL